MRRARLRNVTGVWNFSKSKALRSRNFFASTFADKCEGGANQSWCRYYWTLGCTTGWRWTVAGCANGLPNNRVKELRPPS